MKVTYETVVLGFGNHASIELPDDVLAQIGGNKRAPLKVTVNGYTYRSTAAVMNGVCMVVFPMRDREAAGVRSGDAVMVTLELEAGYREVEIPDMLLRALEAAGILSAFKELTYSKRKEYCRQVAEAKAEETRARRVSKIIDDIKHL